MTTNTWGEIQTTKSRSLYMDGKAPTDALVLVENTGLSDTTKVEIDPTYHAFTRRIGGKNITFESVIEGARVTRYTGTLAFNGEDWNPLKEIAEKGNCVTTLYSVTNCPSARQYEKATVRTRFIAKVPVVATADHDIGNETIAITEQSEADWTELFHIYALRTDVVQTLSESAYAIALKTEDCVDCQDSLFQNFLVLATDGDSFSSYVTTDRFATMTDKTAIGSAAPSGSIPNSGIWSDDNILVGFSNSGGTTGGTVFSSDGGATATVDTNITESVFAVGEFDGQYIAAGGALGGQAKVWLSSNGTVWTSVSSANLPATKAILAMDVDNSTGIVYFVGEDGLLLKGMRSGANALIISALTLPGSVGSTDIQSVRVLNTNHFAVGGAGGYYAESYDGGSTFVQPVVTTTSNIKALTGDIFRTIYGAGTTLTTRDPITYKKFKNLPFEAGSSITGNIVGAVSLSGNRNYFAAVTDDGEIIRSVSFRPNA